MTLPTEEECGMSSRPLTMTIALLRKVASFARTLREVFLWRDGLRVRTPSGAAARRPRKPVSVHARRRHHRRTDPAPVLRATPCTLCFTGVAAVAAPHPPRAAPARK